MPDQPNIEQTVDRGLAVVGETARESFNRLMSGDPTVLLDIATKYLLPATVALIAVFIGYLVAKFVARTISGPICKRIDETLGKFIGRVTFYTVLLSVVGVVCN